MTRQEVIALLEANKNERGIKAWEKMEQSKTKRSFGLGLTQLKKLAKQVGKDHELAKELWQSDIFDAQQMAILIDDPKKVSREQIESQLAVLNSWMFTHTYCSTLLAKVPFAIDLSNEWMHSENNVYKRCAYLMLYNTAKDNKKLPDSYFEPWLDEIEKHTQTAENFTKDAMNSALVRIGWRSKALNERAVAIAHKLGKVTVDYGDNSCEAIDAIKHLTSERIQKKFA